MRRDKLQFDFVYSEYDDVFSIFDYNKPVIESLEFNEFINVNYGKDGLIVGFEIFDASKFFGALNSEINKEFLKSVEKVELVQVEERNNYFLMILLFSQQKTIQQQLPILRRSDYVSPLIASCNKL